MLATVGSISVHLYCLNKLNDGTTAWAPGYTLDPLYVVNMVKYVKLLYAA